MITNSPVQPAALMYGRDAGWEPYARPGGLVVANNNEQAQGFKNISAAGGSVLVYLDTVICNVAYGRYHQKLFNASEFGPAVPRWPELPKANGWGWVMDFQFGGVLQQKLEGVLELMCAEIPHMAGWFADDVGSRSWFSNLVWGSFSTADKQAYRDGAIGICKTFRKVADKYRLIFLVNGTWTANDGGGYPDVGQFGNALAEGGFVENHAANDFWRAYVGSAQWAAQSPVTGGKSFNWATTRNQADLSGLQGMTGVAFASLQPDYSTAPAPWSELHATGLPNKVIYPA